jgi:hypothetical protein
MLLQVQDIPAIAFKQFPSGKYLALVRIGNLDFEGFSTLGEQAWPG